MGALPYVSSRGSGVLDHFQTVVVYFEDALGLAGARVAGVDLRLEVVAPGGEAGLFVVDTLHLPVVALLGELAGDIGTVGALDLAVDGDNLGTDLGELLGQPGQGVALRGWRDVVGREGGEVVGKRLND